MRRAFCAVILAALTLGASSALAGQGGNCSPEGTWYGYNEQGIVWVVTISRSGPQSFTSVMDWGANADGPPLVRSTDWRGELVKTGPRSYDWTSIAFYGTDDPTLPFVLGFGPWTAEFTDCDSFMGAGTTSFYGILSYDQDPFEAGIWVGDLAPNQAFFRRMPMSYPE